MEKNIQIHHHQIRLEGRIDLYSDRWAAIVCHPHPLYGGDMDNTVVNAICQEFSEKKITTLRFNFRGAGASTGTFDDGIGEQADVRAVIDWLRSHDYQQIILAGYSFGAAVNAHLLAKGCDVQDHIMISPPVDFMDFQDILSLPSTGLVVTGEEDTFATPGAVEKQIRRWQIFPQYQVLPNCDHFYSGQMSALKTCLADYLEKKKYCT